MIHVDRDSTAPKRVGDDSGRIDSRFPDHRSLAGGGWGEGAVRADPYAANACCGTSKS